MTLSMIGMNGCSIVNYDTSSEVCRKLEQKYNCKFLPLSIGDRLDKNTATVYACPENNENIVFTAKIDTDGNVTDDYVARLKANEVEQSIQNLLNKKGVESLIRAFAIPETNREINEGNVNISLAEFVAKYSIEDFYTMVVIEKSTVNNVDLIECFNESYNDDFVEINIAGFILNTDNYEKYCNQMKKFDCLSLDEIEKYVPTAKFTTIVNSKGSSLSSEELYRIMEE